MEETINSLNVELGVFLHNLRSLTADENGKLGNKTVELLMEIVDYIDELVAKRLTVDVPNEANVDFLKVLNTRHFELRQSIMCRLCIEPIRVSRDEYQAHIVKSTHLARVQQSVTPPIMRISDGWSLTMNSEQRSNDNSMDVNIQRSTTKMEQSFSDQTDEPSDGEASAQEERPIQPVAKPHDTAFLRKPNLACSRLYTRVACSDDSDSSQPLSDHFNLDAKYLIGLRGLPWSATKQDVLRFFKDVNILNGLKGIHFILDEKDRKNGRAYVQLEQLRDYKAALKLHRHHMDDRYIEIHAENDRTFQEMVEKREIPSKERVVLIEGFPSSYSEKDIRTFFNDLSIEKVKHTENTSRAYVKFKSVNDVELAIKRNDKQTNVRIYRSTNQQMKTERKQDSVPSMTSRSSPQHDSTESHRASEFMKVRGLPWNTEKAEIIALFPGLSIDRKNGIQIERDDKNRFTGVAYVAFNDPEDLKIALKTDFTSVNQYIKMSPCTKAQFIMAKEGNEQQIQL